MEDRPSITVIVPVFNGIRYIGEALQSIRTQQYQPLEILVIDDGSTDGVAGLLSADFPDVRCHRREHLGLPSARNTGLALASGALIGFLDSDDVWAPGKINLQADILTQQPELDAVFGHIRQFYSPENEEEVRDHYRFSQEVLPGLHPDTMLAHATAIRRVGGFDPKVEMGEFLDWFARAKDANFSYRVLPEVLAYRRIHAGNMGIQRRDETASGYAHLLKAALDRRRKPPR
jgi:glycosyltransferase involved in cell wall biosynthesis